MIGRVRAYVFKFAAKVVAGKAIAFLERDVRRGLVAIESAEFSGWRPVDGLADIALPTDRPARLLLLVHGAFSSTVGSFGALVATPEGRHFLESALSSYDAVLGFDHPTLSLDPLENASDILHRLATADAAVPPTIDVLCYSRGGLVARSLIEQLLPSSSWRANPGRVVFVAATNGGTALAEPQNWHDFVDLYMNLAAACARAVGLISGAAPMAEVVKGLIESVGAFVISPADSGEDSQNRGSEQSEHGDVHGGECSTGEREVPALQHRGHRQHECHEPDRARDRARSTCVEGVATGVLAVELIMNEGRPPRALFSHYFLVNSLLKSLFKKPACSASRSRPCGYGDGSFT
ncbi:hypothetical protein ACFYT3_31805 [Nocardia amikacinitolerans]|uniref:DUF7379 domain-containing protein n=1 Tax=Nocardia amikacinitolerans TaxID=756689 RepID=UPI00368644C3